MSFISASKESLEVSGILVVLYMKKQRKEVLRFILILMVFYGVKIQKRRLLVKTKELLAWISGMCKVEAVTHVNVS